MHKRVSGFTIVELLIVIVVIGILALITIVAFNGIQSRTRSAAVSSDLVAASKKLALYLIDNGTYPADLTALTAAGIAPSPNTSFQYSVNNAVSPQSFCITATNSTTSYKITQSTTPTSGGCAGHGVSGQSAVTNLSTNPSVEVNLVDHSPAASSTITRELNASAPAGSYAIKIVTQGLVANEGEIMAMPAAGFGSYSASVYLWGSGTISLFLRFGFTDSTFIQSPSTVTTALNGTPQRFVISGTFANNGKTPSYLHLHVRTSSTQAVTFFEDGFMVNSGSTVNYADGNSTDWIWNGAVNNSTSTGPPL